MKKNKKNKKIMLGILAPLAVVTPLAAVISCGKTEDKNSAGSNNTSRMERMITDKTNKEIRDAFAKRTVLEFKGIESEKVLTKLFAALTEASNDLVTGKSLKVANAQYDQFTKDDTKTIKEKIKKNGKLTIADLAIILGWDSYEHGQIVSTDGDFKLLNEAIHKKIDDKDKDSKDWEVKNNWRNDQFRPTGPKDQNLDKNHMPNKKYNLRSNLTTFLISPNHKSNILSHWNMIVNAKVGDIFRFNWTPSITNVVSRMFAFSELTYKVTDTRFWRLITPEVLDEIKAHNAATLGDEYLSMALPDPLAKRMLNKSFKTPKMREVAREIHLAIGDPTGWHKSFRYGYVIIGDMFDMTFGGKNYQIKITKDNWDFLKLAGVNKESVYRNQVKIISKIRELFIKQGYEINASDPTKTDGKNPDEVDVNEAFAKFIGTHHVPDVVNINEVDPNDSTVYLDQGSSAWHQLFRGSGDTRVIPKAGVEIGVKINGVKYKFAWTDADVAYLIGKRWHIKQINQQDVVNYVIKRLAESNPTISEAEIKHVLTFGHHGLKV